MSYVPYQQRQQERSKKARKRKQKRLICDDCGYRAVERVDPVPMVWGILPKGRIYVRCIECQGIFECSLTEWQLEQDRSAYNTGKRDREPGDRVEDVNPFVDPWLEYLKTFEDDDHA